MDAGRRLVAVVSALLVLAAGCGGSGEASFSDSETIRLVRRDAATLAEFTQWISRVEFFVSDYWNEHSGLFPVADGPSRAVVVIVPPGETVTTPCGGGTAGDTALKYCDDHIFLGVRRLWDTYRSDGEYGDFAAAFIVAHEWAHNVQAELGRWEAKRKPWYELQADCFAGTWARHELEAGRLEKGDLEEALLVAWDGGGDQTHGSAEARLVAVMRGYQADDGAAACFRYEEFE